MRYLLEIPLLILLLASAAQVEQPKEPVLDPSNYEWEANEIPLWEDGKIDKPLLSVNEGDSVNLSELQTIIRVQGEALWLLGLRLQKLEDRLSRLEPKPLKEETKPNKETKLVNTLIMHWFPACDHCKRWWKTEPNIYRDVGYTVQNKLDEPVRQDKVYPWYEFYNKQGDYHEFNSGFLTRDEFNNFIRENSK